MPFHYDPFIASGLGVLRDYGPRQVGALGHVTAGPNAGDYVFDGVGWRHYPVIRTSSQSNVTITNCVIINKGAITMPTPEAGQIWRSKTDSDYHARIVEVAEIMLVVALTDEPLNPYRMWSRKNFLLDWEPVPPPPIVLGGEIAEIDGARGNCIRMALLIDKGIIVKTAMKIGTRYKITLEEES